MRILLASMYYRPCVGGVENSLFHMARTLRQMGHDPVVLASASNWERPEEPLPLREEIDGTEVRRVVVRLHRMDLATILRGQVVARFRREIVRLNAEAHIDLVVARNHLVVLASLSAVPRIETVYVVPSVVASHDRQLIAASRTNGSMLQAGKLCLLRSIVVPAEMRLQRSALRAADRVVVFSENMKRQIKREGCVAPDRLEVIPPGVDLDRFDRPEGSAALRRGLGIPDQSLLCLTVARLSAVKGLDLALEALHRLRGRVDARLVVVGTGPAEPQLRATARRLGMEGEVHFVGRTEAPEEFYPAADVFLMTSQSEAFGQTVLEAMASRLTVVAFDGRKSAQIMTATAEIIDDNDTGLLCDYGAGPLVEAIVRAYTLGPAGRQALGSRAREAVRQRYSWDRFCTRLVKYREGAAAQEGAVRER